MTVSLSGLASGRWLALRKLALEPWMSAMMSAAMRTFSYIA